ncbi:hypothetical protein [Streptomyces solincola]|uniref:hypothetical protein n=1 Tax=Streptomyces solincola TaxID=2100817 RepID=UPI0015E2B368|nr:hypothetical protein [Streptomyces solincola]
MLRIASETSGVEELQEDLESILDLVQKNPERRSDFVIEIGVMLDSLVDGVVETVCFLMHELRWAEVEGEIRSRAADPGDDVSNLRLYEAMLDAFSDSWRDRDLYRKYS